MAQICRAVTQECRLAARVWGGPSQSPRFELCNLYVKVTEISARVTTEPSRKSETSDANPESTLRMILLIGWLGTVCLFTQTLTKGDLFVLLVRSMSFSALEKNREEHSNCKNKKTENN